MAEAMEVNFPIDASCKDVVQAETDYLNGKAINPDYVRIFPRSGPMPASEAAKKIEEFTKSFPEPFAVGPGIAGPLAYPYENPWASKKDNKGKKPRPPGMHKPKHAVEA